VKLAYVGPAPGILNVTVTEPILHEAQIGARLQQLGGDGVLEATEVTLGGRQIGGFAIAFHQPVDRAPRERNSITHRLSDDDAGQAYILPPG